jgi:hypothetical protein
MQWIDKIKQGLQKISVRFNAVCAVSIRHAKDTFGGVPLFLRVFLFSCNATTPEPAAGIEGSVSGSIVAMCKDDG